MSLDRLLELGFERTPAVPTATEVRRPDRRTVLLTTGRAAMGTLVSVSALGPGRDRLEDAVGRAFQEMDRLIAVFSRFAADSALTVLNDAGRLSGPPRELAFVLERALGYHETTGGAFDVTVAPLVDLFRNRLRDVRPAPPAEAEIRAARALVGVGRVRISRREIRFQRSGMAITLDGIAKGYIVDAMATVLARAGVRDFLINAGGDIRTAGRGAGGRPWTVGVRDPDGSGALPDVLHVTDAAVATSGGYEIWFDPERRFHHIVDAGTGRSPRHNAAASVLAPTAMAADALATAVFVLPPARGLALVDSLAGCACLIIGADGRQWRSAGWRSAPPLPTPTAME